ncbi:MAG TPA: RHS repeat-associated core domain-containing protein, partial [Candidatus Angelobacter sp.]
GSSFTASAPYGPGSNSTAGQVASALISTGSTGLNRPGSPVHAGVSGANIALAWNAAGSAGNVAVTATSTPDNSSMFPGGSFSGSTNLTGGQDPYASGLAHPYVTLYSNDTLGNLTCAVQKGSDTTAFTSCGAAPASWRPRSFTYDSLSRLLTATNPESGTISYSYDANGNVLQRTSPGPNQSGTATQAISYCYDALNRVTGKAYSAQTCTNGQLPANTAVVSYFYDQTSYQGLTISNGKGRLTGLSDQAGTGAYSYDTMGRIASESRKISGVTKNLVYIFNLDGSVKTLTYPSGAVITYAPNGAGRTVSAIDLGNNINYVTGSTGPGSNATYAPNGLAVAYTNGWTSSFGGIANSFSFNKRLQPVTMSASAPTQSVFNVSYDFHLGNGDNGNVFAVTNNRDTSRSQTFTYDTLNRLISAQNAGTDCSQHTVNGLTKFWGNSYGYDAWSNLLQKTVTKCSAENLSVIAAANNQIHTGNPPAQNQSCASSPDYLYDAAGNMTCNISGSLTPQSYGYDAENRINGAGGDTYTYNANGNRVEKSNGSTGTIYWYMTPGIVAESDLTGALKSEYVFFNNQRVARKDFPGNSVFYYFSGHLKTASVITDSAGNIKEDEDYYPWGGELQFINNDSNHYKFTGKERDSETGLDYFGARYYGNMLGRFITPDPLIGHPEDPQTLNRYAYVRNNPLTLADPTGLDFYLWCGDKTLSCQHHHIGKTTTDANGKPHFQATVIGNDSNGNLVDKTTGTGSYTGTFDGKTVAFTDSKGNHSVGSWKQGSDPTRGIEGTGALGRFNFTFMNHNAVQNLYAQWTFKGTPEEAGRALEKAGFVHFNVGFHFGYTEYRSPSEQRDSVHFNIGNVTRNPWVGELPFGWQTHGDMHDHEWYAWGSTLINHFFDDVLQLGTTECNAKRLKC